jgi:cupin fold WbuC family metalloprotein
MDRIDDLRLDEVSHQAQASPRLRMYYNFHDSIHSPSQRLLNALEPGTVLPIHRHEFTDETYIALRGSLWVRFYDENKQVLEEVLLNPANGYFGVNIPTGQWHSIEVLESGTVIFECKDGPYAPLEEKDILL